MPYPHPFVLSVAAAEKILYLPCTQALALARREGPHAKMKIKVEE